MYKNASILLVLFVNFYLLYPLFKTKSSFLSLTVTNTLLPAFIFPSRILSASSSSISFWIVLLNGRAPYFASYPLSTIYALASSSSSTESLICYIILSLIVFIIISTICPICSFLSIWNTIMSSIRFKNSGLNILLTSSITLFFISS